jgi:hypothetical protein
LKEICPYNNYRFTNSAISNVALATNEEFVNLIQLLVMLNAFGSILGTFIKPLLSEIL